MASGEISTITTEAVPCIIMALKTYGEAVLARVRDDAAHSAVSTGLELLQRVFGRRKNGDPLPDPLAALVNAPDDADALTALRRAIRMKLEADAEMLADVHKILARPPALVIRPGRDSYYSARDMTITRNAD